MKKRMLLCVCLCFVLLLSGCSPYYIGNRLGKLYDWCNETGDVCYQFTLFHKNAFGLVTVYEIGDTVENSSMILALSGVSLDKPKTHFTMLSAYEGMTLPQLVAAVGMPDGIRGSGLVRLCYVWDNGYIYDFFANRDGIVYGISIQDPEGNYLNTDEAVAAFQWKVRLTYLGVAAVLGVALVALIKVPKVIRKCKTATQSD